MNLKQAARTLGVHYQTAYRWVRSGELAAVKVGSRYVVSEGAIEHFQRRRDSLLAAPSSPPLLEPSQADADRTALADLRILASETRTTARPCFEAAAALAATQVGDAALVRLLDESGEWLEPVASYAADPQLRATVAGAAEAAGSFPRETPHWAAAEFSGDVHVVHHMPQDLVMNLMGDDGRFAARDLRVLAGAVAPILSGSRFVGGILALKTTSTVPFRDDQLELMRDIAQVCGEAYAKADRFVNAWHANSHVTDRLTELATDGCALDELAEIGGELLDAERAQAVAASDGSIICSTEAFDAATALPPTELRKPGALLRLWQADGLREILKSATSRAEMEPLDPDTPGAIVSVVRDLRGSVVVFPVDAIE